ncbi:MAG: hypothetical protein II981_06820 [Bacteroidales bacterium]|nr:hypothetical protein [Bacteroidales bacterium]
MKKAVFVLSFLFIVVKLSAQNNLNEIANEQYHKIAQIEGTEDILIDYFSKIKNQNDTLYAFISPLMASPRLEGIMPIVQEMLYYKNPNNPMVLIASFQNEDAARKYVENKFFFEDVIYDTDKSYKSFLAFNTEDLRVPLLMKIDRKSGRLLTGGDFIEISPNFINLLVNHTEPMPFYGEVWSEKINYDHSTSDCENESYKKAKALREMTIPLDEDTFISSVEFPIITNDYLSFLDELNNAIYLYSMKDKNNLVFAGMFKPNKTEETYYISDDVEKEYYVEDLERGSIVAMCITSFMKDSETILFSASLPNLYYEDENKQRLVYFNKAVMISQNINDINDRKLIPLEFNNNGFQYISHENFHYSSDFDKYFFITLKDYNPSRMTLEKKSYDDTRLFSIYDEKKDEFIGGIGQLGQINMDLNVGWVYVYPRISTFGNIIAVSDGNSGEVLVYDYENLKEPLYKTKVFDVRLSDFEIDSTLIGTEEYFLQFQDDFKNYVLDVEIDSKNLYTLSLEDGCYFKKVYDKKGKLKKTLLIPSVYNSCQLEVSGLCRIDGKTHVMAFYFDGEKHTMVLF